MPPPAPRNLVFCCDGTGHIAEAPATNVVHLHRRLRDAPATQLSRYEPGVGTFSVLTPWRGGPVGRALGLLFGYGLRRNIDNGHRFLTEHYRQGDRIFLFGFSRGAYAVRALAGRLEAERLPVHFLGAWDTVASLGYLIRRRTFDARATPGATHVRHALAMDEKRPKFEPLRWTEPPLADHQSREEVWFPGAHADVGGGYPERGHPRQRPPAPGADRLRTRPARGLPGGCHPARTGVGETPLHC
ncbi:MAG: phospholipase effector Tle1 domain-containing protein [Pseudomonadota bacterium]